MLRKGDPGRSDLGWNSSMAAGAHRPDSDSPKHEYHAPYSWGEVERVRDYVAA